MFIREYIKNDSNEIFNLFYNSVHNINRNYYTDEELCAWAKKDTDISEWCKKFEDSYSLVAVDNEKIIGFANIEQNGYIECIYVDEKNQNKKIGTELINKMQNYIKKENKNQLSAYSSKNAKAFFEKLGFKNISLNLLIKDKCELEIFYMEKNI